GAAYPVASDTLLYLFDQSQAMARLESHESRWGGDIEQRMARQATDYLTSRSSDVAGTLTDPLPVQADRNPETGE
ncbi:MAG: hypothetical protein AAFW97_12255, partial [Pseudomonadota bacterium]